MKYGFSMEMVDLHRQEPNRNRRESKYFWDEIFTLVAAAGFKGIELPYEMKWDFGGRSGIPLSKRAVAIKFGSVRGFIKDLGGKGIEKVSGLHFDPTLFSGDDQDTYFSAFEHFASEALSFAEEAGCDSLTITATPPIGSLGKMCGDEDAFLDRTAGLINRLAGTGEAGGVRICVKNEYWGLLRGERLHGFMSRISDDVYYAVDTANLAIAGADPGDFIMACAGRIGSVQLTDTAFVDNAEYYKQPMPEFPAGKATQIFRDLGQGNVNFAAVMNALEAAGYDGWVIINNRQTRDICRGLLRARYYIDSMEAKG